MSQVPCSLLGCVPRPARLIHSVMSLPLLPPNIAEITAPPLFGSVWNWTLYGVLVVQLYVYSYNFPNDRRSLKLLVYAVFLIETVQTALSGADLYFRFASGFGNMVHLSDPYVSAFEVPLIGAVVSITVQYFFAYRVWVLSNKRSKWLCLIICVCSAINALAAFSWGVYAHVVKKFVSGWKLKLFAWTWLIGNTAADTLIAALMLYYLTRRRNTVGHLQNHAVSRIIRLTVETNIVTSATGIVALLMVAIFPNKNWYTCPTSILGKLYSNTLLVSLNNRISIREESYVGGPLSESQDLPSRLPSGIVHLELEKLSFGSKEGTQSRETNDERKERVIDIS